MRKVVASIVLLAGLSTACSSPLGTTIPECDAVSGTLVLAVQAVPGSDYVSCVNGLKAGWGFQDLKARNGLSTYSLDSDRMGFTFLRVENRQSCEPSGVLVDPPQPDVQLWKDVSAEISVDIMVIPEGPTEETATRTLDVVLELGDLEINGREARISPSVTGGTTSERIADATAIGAHMIIISIRDVEEGTFTVLLDGSPTEVKVDDLDDAIDLIEDVEDESSYEGNWYYVFDGGCVVYEFSAEGSGVASLEADIESALGLYDAESLRQAARDQGYRIP